MATQAQITANRLNAQNSTGPQSEEGKGRSAMNALKSGLDAQSVVIPGESPEAFAQLQSEYYSQYNPADPEQRFHLDTAIVAEWHLRRFKNIEEQLWAFGAARVENPIAGLELAQILHQDDKVMMRLHRRVAHARKTYTESMAAFHRLQAAQAAPQPQQITAPLPELGSFQPREYRGPSDPFLDALSAHLHQIEIVAKASGVQEPAPNGEDDAAA
jgi:hypothetical protein